MSKKVSKSKSKGQRREGDDDSIVSIDIDIRQKEVQKVSEPIESVPVAATPVRDSMAELLRELQDAVRENSQLLNRIGPKESEFKNRSDRVPVEIRVWFQRLIDVDTKEQNFHAEIYIQAKWTEPKLEGLGQMALDELDFRNYWDPKILLTNVEGEADEDHHWYVASESEAGYKFPVIFYRRRVRAKFNEVLELRNFPVDTQALTVQISSERSARELDFFEDRCQMSNVNTSNFDDVEEFKLYDHVEVTKSTRKSASTDVRYGKPVMDFRCHVARKSGYFVWNVMFIMFLVTALSFTAYSIDANMPESRLGVTLTLLLTGVAFKIVIARSLPSVSYITDLDLYVMCSLVFLCLQAVQNSVSGWFALKEEEDLADKIDLGTIIGLAVLLFLFHIIYIAVLTYKAYSARKDLRRKDELYDRRRREWTSTAYKRPSPTSQALPSGDPIYQNDNLNYFR